MHEIDDKILDRLKKLRALAERGVGGEKSTAQKKLNKLLKENNLTLESLDEVTPQYFLFKYTNKHTYRLLLQIMHKVVTPSLPDDLPLNYYKSKGTRNKIGIYCTPAQKLEIELDYEFYTELLDREIDTLLSAFIQKQDIFPANGPVSHIDPTEMSAEDLQELARIQQYANNIQYVNRHKMIEDNNY